MAFRQRIRQLRQAKNLTLRDLAAMVGVDFTYLSKIENGKLDFGEYPSEALICKLAKVLDADENELLILAEKIPQGLKKRIMQRPEAFRIFADLDDDALDRLLRQIGKE